MNLQIPTISGASCVRVTRDGTQTPPVLQTRMPPIRTPRRSEAPPGAGVIEPSTPNGPASYSPTPHNGLTLRHTQRYVGRLSGVQNFSQADLRAMLEILEEVVPYDVDSWDLVRERYVIVSITMEFSPT